MHSDNIFDVAAHVLEYEISVFYPPEKNCSYLKSSAMIGFKVRLKEINIKQSKGGSQ